MWKVYQWLATGCWFSPGAPVSFTKKTDRRDIAEILLKVGLRHHSLTPEISTFGYTAFFCYNIFCWSVCLIDKIKLLKLMIFFKGFSNKSKVVILNSLSLKVALNTIASYPICLHSLTHPALHQSALSNLSRLITYTAYMSVCILIYNTLTINRFIVSCYFFS